LAHDNEILGKFLIGQNSRPKNARLLSDVLLIVVSIVTQIKWMRFKVMTLKSYQGISVEMSEILAQISLNINGH